MNTEIETPPTPPQCQAGEPLAAAGEPAAATKRKPSPAQSPEVEETK